MGRQADDNKNRVEALRRCLALKNVESVATDLGIPSESIHDWFERLVLPALPALLSEGTNEASPGQEQATAPVDDEAGMALKELEIARRIQESFLPREFPSVSGVEMAATMRPAHEVGGDFYDVFSLTSGRLGFLIGDVSGKGIPASLFMALTRTLLRTHSLSARPRYLSDALESRNIQRLMRSGSLGALAALGAVRQTNDYMIQNHDEPCIFLTLFYAVFEPHSNLLTYVNAGHNPPLLFDTQTGKYDWLQPTDTVIGVVPDRPYEAKERQMTSGNVLVLYSDGVTEAFNSSGEMFGTQRLVDVVKTFQPTSARELLRAIESAVVNFVGDAPQSDDLTLLVMLNN
jgi:sigma-B regulation protein RsbU (phosphoserine phosphatase)